jgi:hypothetical protein
MLQIRDNIRLSINAIPGTEAFLQPDNSLPVPKCMVSHWTQVFIAMNTQANHSTPWVELC